MGDYVGVVIGSIGSFLMILAYILLNFQRDLGRFGLNEDSILYNLLNFVGGALASASAIIAGTIDSYPLAVLEGVWGIVGFVGLVRIGLSRRKGRTQQEDGA